MIETIRRIIARLFPELIAGYHLPVFGIVVSQADAPRQGGLADPYRPRYAVDIQLLDEHGNLDSAQETLESVPVTMPGAGQERGFASLPQAGAVVEIAWAYGRPTQPFVRSVLPTRQSLPACGANDQVWQQRQEVHQKVDGQGNWERNTDATITDQSHTHITQTVDKIQQIQNEMRRIYEHSLEQVGGIKRIEASAIKLLSTGHANLSAGQGLNLTAGGDLNQTTGGNHRQVSKGSQHIEGDTVWLGNKQNNILQILADFMATTAAALQELDGHTHGHPHGPTAPPSVAGSVAAKASSINTAHANQLTPITKT